MRNGVLLLAVALAGGPVAAHEFWIEPTEARYQPGDTVTAELKVGLDLAGAPYPYLSNRFVAFTVDGVAVSGSEGDLPALIFVADEAGLHTVAHQTVPFRAEHDDWQAFLDYLALEGLDGIAAEHSRRGLPETGFAERYTRHARALIQIGAPRPDDSDRPSGLPFELVAEGSPFLPGAGSSSVRLTRDDVPVADHQVTVYARHGAVQRTTLRTDVEGRATVSLRPGGSYLLNAVVLEPVEDGPVVWESHWASLGFRLPPAQQGGVSWRNGGTDPRGVEADRGLVRGLQREPPAFRAQDALAARVHPGIKETRLTVRPNGGKTITQVEPRTFCLQLRTTSDRPNHL